MFVIAALIVTPVHAGPAKLEKQIMALLHRQPAELEPLVKVQGDGLDPRITVSSYGATQIVSKGWIASTTIEDSFLRAFIDKKTGAVSAQIYHIASYGGKNWHFYQSATYQAPDGLKETQISRIDSDVNCYRHGCAYQEQMVFPIEFSMLEAMAVKFNPANPLNGLAYRVFAKSGERIDAAIPENEIVAFVNVVNRARAK